MCPEWITETVWKQLQDQWNSVDFKGKSEQAKKNRASDVDGLGSSLHTGSFIPTTEHKRRLVNLFYLLSLLNVCQIFIIFLDLFYILSSFLRL